MSFEGTLTFRSERLAALPPENPVKLKLITPNSFEHCNKFNTFSELPLPVIARTTSPGDATERKYALKARE
jgi:hypothetical protein